MLLISLFISFFQIPVILSIPSKLELHMNNISTISGAGIAHTVQYIHIPIHTIQPRNPQILFEDTPDLDWNIFAT